MGEYIMVGLDVHDAGIMVKMAEGNGAAQTRRIANTPDGRRSLWEELKAQAGRRKRKQVVMAYEASGVGFGLYDEARKEGFACHVLAPTKMTRSPAARKRKTDEADAQQILEIVRGHVLAGNRLPTVWVPDRQTRDDREVVRTRLDLGGKLALVKTQVRTLLKRNGLRKPSWVGKAWSRTDERWLAGVRKDPKVPPGVRVALDSLLRQKEQLEEELGRLDEEVERLAGEGRHREPVAALTGVRGVGLLTAMVVLTELGDLGRFNNRRKLGAYLGLVPSSHESGQEADRKGHITHQGSGRVRKVLCQSAWQRRRLDPTERQVYARIVEKNPKHKKIAVVALMRRLAVLLWHLGREAQMRVASAAAAA